jgi:hypothetical protein
MLGKRFSAPINQVDTIEGIVTSYDDNTGSVSLLTDDGDIFHGYEYQLESIEPE